MEIRRENERRVLMHCRVLRDESRRAEDQLEQRGARDAKSDRKGGCKCFNSTLQGEWGLGLDGVTA